MPVPSRGPFKITQDDEKAWKALLGLVALGWFASVVAIGLAVRAADLSEHGPFEVLDKYVPLSLLGPVLIGIVAAVLVKWKSWKVGAIASVLLSVAGAVPQHGLYTVTKSFPESYGHVVEEEQRRENFAKHHENFQRVMKECGGLVSRQWENILTDPSMASAMQPRGAILCS